MSTQTVPPSSRDRLCDLDRPASRGGSSPPPRGRRRGPEGHRLAGLGIEPAIVLDRSWRDLARLSRRPGPTPPAHPKASDDAVRLLDQVDRQPTSPASGIVRRIGDFWTPVRACGRAIGPEIGRDRLDRDLVEPDEDATHGHAVRLERAIGADRGDPEIAPVPPAGSKAMNPPASGREPIVTEPRTFAVGNRSGPSSSEQPEDGQSVDQKDERSGVEGHDAVPSGRNQLVERDREVDLGHRQARRPIARLRHPRSLSPPGPKPSMRRPPRRPRPA